MGLYKQFQELGTGVCGCVVGEGEGMRCAMKGGTLGAQQLQDLGTGVCEGGGGE